LYEKERQTFRKIKERLENYRYKENLKEFEAAIKKLITEYNTSNWENRFIVGGALEVLFCALLKSIGFECKWLREARYDIEVDGAKFSMKSNLTGSGDIRLINILGDERVEWKEATLFFISNLGICYADPDMNLKTRHTNDALVINVKRIKENISNNSEWLIPINIPRKPQNSSKIKTASYDVAKSILEDIDSKYLKNYLPEL